MDRLQTWIALIIGSIIYLYADRYIGDGSHTWRNVIDAAYWGGFALFVHGIYN